MGHIKKWLYGKFLPMWCREELMDTNARLRDTITALKQENRRLESYIDGMETALRHCGRISTHTDGVSL